MVPLAVAADLDDVDAELRQLMGEREELARRAGLAVDVAAEAVAEGVADPGEPVARADGTRLPGGLSVIARGTDEIGLRVTHLMRRSAAGGKLGEGRAPGEGV